MKKTREEKKKVTREETGKGKGKDIGKDKHTYITLTTSPALMFFCSQSSAMAILLECLLDNSLGRRPFLSCAATPININHMPSTSTTSSCHHNNTPPQQHATTRHLSEHVKHRERLLFHAHDHCHCVSAEGHPMNSR